MNANRMKYASTPTFGMQKRSLLKKPTAQRILEAPDFSQVPNPANTMPPQFFSVPQQGNFQQPPSAQAGNFHLQSPYFPPNLSIPPMQQTAQLPFTGSSFINSNGSIPPFSPMQNQMPMQPFQNIQPQNPMQPTLGSTTSPANTSNNGFSPRYQGYVPPAPQWQTMPPVMQNSAARPAVQPAAFSGGQIPPFFSGMQQGTAMGQQHMGFQPASQPMPPTYQPVQQNASNLPPMYPAQPTQRQPMDTNKLWSIFLFGLLPLLFIPCLFVPNSLNFLRYAFLALSVCGLGAMWYRQLFTSSTRLIVSIVYVALSIVTISMMMQGERDAQQVGNNNLGNQQPSAQSMQNPNGGNAAVTPSVAPTETPSPQNLGPSETEQRLSTFMNLWKGNNTPEMVSYVQPSWASAQDTPSQQLFIVLANRTPEDFAIEDVSGTDDDNSRTVTMTATINKNNGKDPAIYRFMVLMVKENGEWYVDPNSLATNDEIKTNDENVVNSQQSAGLATAAPRTTVTPVPPGDTALYFNPDKGSFYHADQNCPGVKAEYLPLAGNFLYNQLGNDEYKSLQPCLKCGAPTEKLATDPPL